MDRRATTMAALRTALDLELPAAMELRRRVHAEPELSGEEERTAARVSEAIAAGGAVTSTEVIADVGRLIRIGAASGPSVAIRAELDALPLTEHTGSHDAATNGAMHACGHDVHLAAVAALARAAQSVELPVPLLVILQPREERPPSGAKEIVAAKALQEHDVRAVIGAHVQPLLARGVIAATEGAVNASTDELDIRITGRGGHGGYPHLTRDPVVAMAQVIVALQQVVSRRIDPLHPAVLTIGSVHAGSAANVIPDEAHARGTLRLLETCERLAVHQEIRTIATHVAEAFGCHADIEIQDGEPALVNDPLLTAATHPWLTEAGFEVSAPLRSCGADDFSHYGDVARILMMFVGVDPHPGLPPAGLHHPTFRPPDEAVRDVALALLSGYIAGTDASIVGRVGTDGP
ncbi:MAG: M20 metallopeptidase family protein [Nocardioides sp.]